MKLRYKVIKEKINKDNNWLIMLVTVVTLISSHVKDKNSIFTAHDEYMIFQQKKNSWYFISIYIIKLFNLQSWTKLDKITCLESIFLDIKAVAILPSPSRWKQCCCVFKRKPDPWAFVGSNFGLGEGVIFTQSH